jgi:hypothetical protein
VTARLSWTRSVGLRHLSSCALLNRCLQEMTTAAFLAYTGWWPGLALEAELLTQLQGLRGMVRS